MIDDHDQNRRQPISLRALAAMLPPDPPDVMAEQTLLEWDQRMEAWYAGLHRDIVVVPLKHACEGVPEGWLRLVHETKVKLWSTVGDDDARKRLFDNLTVWATDEELGFGASRRGSEVFQGICGRAIRRSRWLCSECGRRGKRRELGEEFVGTLCARCVSKPLLRQQIAELVESEPVLMALGQPIEQVSVPEYLRQSFRSACGADDSVDPVRVRMPIDRFKAWVDEWRNFDMRLCANDRD